MDGDARRAVGPQEVTGYNVHLDYATRPVMRADARPSTTPRRGRSRDDEAGDDPGAKPDDAKADKGDNKDEKKPTPRWKKILYWAIGIAVVLILVAAGIAYWLYARQFETTDDAFIDGHISQVSAQVSARVIRLAVDDYDNVRENQVLVELDPRDFQVKLDQARAQRAQAAAQLDQAKAAMATQQASLDQAQANVRVSEADLQQAQNDLARYRAIDPKAITRQQLETQSSNTKAAQARLDAARQSVEGARANLVVQQAQIEAAQANLAAAAVAVANAELQLSYTHVVAPRDGKIARRTVEAGNYVNPGQALLAVVGVDRWVTANFKETQLARMKAGQRVRVSVDACPNGPFDAKVDSFQPGSGSVFSALPAENATGNYVKVVQRVPVKIVFDDHNFDDCRLSPGMSVGPKVTVR